MKVLSEVISPKTSFALYFQGVLKHQLSGEPVSVESIARLRNRLETSPYWAERFAAFGLSVADLDAVSLGNKNILRLVAGVIPLDNEFSIDGFS